MPTRVRPFVQIASTVETADDPTDIWSVPDGATIISGTGTFGWDYTSFHGESDADYPPSLQSVSLDTVQITNRALVFDAINVITGLRIKATLSSSVTGSVIKALGLPAPYDNLSNPNSSYSVPVDPNLPNLAGWTQFALNFGLGTSPYKGSPGRPALPSLASVQSAYPRGTAYPVTVPITVVSAGVAWGINTYVGPVSNALCRAFYLSPPGEIWRNAGEVGPSHDPSHDILAMVVDEDLHETGPFVGSEHFDDHLENDQGPFAAWGELDIGAVHARGYSYPGEEPIAPTSGDTATGTLTLSAFSLEIDYEPTIEPLFDSTEGGATFTIRSIDLTEGTTVTFDGVDATDIVIVDASTLTGTVPAHVDEADVTVVLIRALDGTTDEFDFSYLDQAIDPESGSILGGTDTTIFWALLQAGATIELSSPDGHPEISPVSVPLVITDFSATFVTPPSLVGVGHFVVTNPDDSTTTFDFRYYLPPIIQPSNGSPNGGTLVTVLRAAQPDPSDGSEFVSGATIIIGGNSAIDLTYVDANKYTFKTPSHVTGTVDIDITNIDSYAFTMNLQQVYYYGFGLAAPLITVSPGQTAHGPLPSSVTIEATVTGILLDTFLWEQIEGPESATIVSPTSKITVVTFTSFTPGLYSFKFTASASTHNFPPIAAITSVRINDLQSPIITFPGA